MGFTKPSTSRPALVSSYLTVSPSPVPEGHRRSVLCGTVLRVAATCLSQAFCSSEPRPSSPCGATARLAHRPSPLCQTYAESATGGG